MRTKGPFRRPCLDCPGVTLAGESRCPVCKKAKEIERKAMRGATPIANRVRRELNQHTQWPCNGCQLIYPPTYLEVDHITPLRDRGTDSLVNIQILCLDCHKVKTIAEAKERACQ